MAKQKIPDEVYVVVKDSKPIGVVEPIEVFVNLADAVKYAESCRKKIPRIKYFILCFPLLTEVPDEK